MSKIEQSVVDETREELTPKTPKQQLWNVVKTILKISITTALLIWVFSKVDINAVKHRLLHPQYWEMYLAAILFFFFSMLVSAWRLMSFFKSLGLNIDSRYNLRLYFLGLFYNFLLPGGIGGDGYKMYLINKTYKTPLKKLFWAVIFDRLSGLWAIGLIVVALVFFLPQIKINLFLPAGVFLAGSAVYYFVARKLFADYTRYFFQAHGKALLLQLFQVLAVICLMMGQPDADLKFPPYLLAFLVSGFGILIPVTAGGAGAREGIFTVLAKNFPAIFPIKPDLGVFLASSFYLISLTVALLGIYYVLLPKRLERGIKSLNEK